MPYIINRYSGEEITVIQDATLNDDTSLLLPGRNYVGYGEIQNENFVFLLENFSNDTPPGKPLSGQLWYDSSNNVLKVYDGAEWYPTGFSHVSETPPATALEGTLWLKPETGQLYVYNSGWKLIGPEALAGFGETKISSQTLIDSVGISRPVLLCNVDDNTLGIFSNSAFEIGTPTPVEGFQTVRKGFNIVNDGNFVGNLLGNSSSASRLETPRLINGVIFDATRNITITANTSSSLVPGSYLTGVSFDGSTTRTFAVDATPNNVLGKVVARDSQGNFSAGSISANLVGNVTGNVTSSGNSTFNIVTANQFIGESLSGNAFSATKLETPRKINGVDFNGTADITITVDANSLTNTRLANNITESNLQSLGNLVSLNILDAGINIGPGVMEIFHDTDLSQAVLKTNLLDGFSFQVTGSGDPELGKLRLINNTQAGILGADAKTTLLPRVNGSANLGTSGFRFNYVYGNIFNSPTINTQTINSTAGDNNVTITSNLIVEGNLAVNGNVTAINSTITTVNDLNLVLANGVESPLFANGAGITVDGANASLSYSVSGDKWTINKDLDAGENDFYTTGLYYGTATSARYADLAEKYVSDDDYEPGTVLIFGGENEVTVSKFYQDNRIAGVVSKNPAFRMNDGLTAKHISMIALQGRVPVKVIGHVKKGDMLVSASETGYATACSDPKIGTVIGKALEAFSGDRGIVEVVVGRI